jgi:hypothetical protein
MTFYVSSITVDQVIDALKAFIEPMTSPAQVVRGQVNRVPMPSNPCVILTELLQTDLSVPATDYQPDDDAASILGPTKIDIQIDFYGQQAGEFCKTVKTAFRSQWGFDQFPAGIKPLYTSDGMQTPLTTGEQQYESRWTLTASMQYNPVITVPQQFADEASVNPVSPADQ